MSEGEYLPKKKHIPNLSSYPPECCMLRSVTWCWGALRRAVTRQACPASQEKAGFCSCGQLLAPAAPSVSAFWRIRYQHEHPWSLLIAITAVSFSETLLVSVILNTCLGIQLQGSSQVRGDCLLRSSRPTQTRRICTLNVASQGVAFKMQRPVIFHHPAQCGLRGIDFACKRSELICWFPIPALRSPNCWSTETNLPPK